LDGSTGSGIFNWIITSDMVTSAVDADGFVPGCGLMQSSVPGQFMDGVGSGNPSHRNGAY